MNIIIRFLVGLLLLVLFSCKNQSDNALELAQNDSIKKYVDLAANDTLPNLQRDQYNKKAFSFIDLKRNDTVVRWYLGEISRNFINVDDSINYFKVSKQHLKKAAEKKDTLNLARYYRHKAVFFKKSIIYDSALYYYNKSEKYYLRTNDENSLGIVYYKRGSLEMNINDYLGAEFRINKALKIFKKTKNFDMMFLSYILLGNISHNLKDYNQAIKFFDIAIKLAKKYNLKVPYSRAKVSLIGMALNNIGNSYREKKEYAKALYYFNKVLKEKGVCKNDPELIAYLYENMAFCYLKMNKNNPESILRKASSIFQEFNNTKENAIVNMYLSQYYNNKKDTFLALKHSNKALYLAKESKETYYYLTVLSNAGVINTAKAPQYIQEYHRINDSILFEERKARNQFYKIQLETNEIAQEKDNAIKQKWVLSSIITGVLIIVILLFVIYSQRAKQKEMRLLQKQQKANEEIYQLMFQQQSIEDEVKLKEKKRIALELHDNIMNKLASTRFNLFALSVKTDEKTIANALEHIDKIKEIENEIRDITHELNKEVFAGSYSFISLLEKLITEQNKLHNTNFELELDTKVNWDKVSSKIKMNLYRILQESLYNIIKYARATRVTINIAREEANLFMAIQDDGIGFDATQTNDGIGIKNMQERAETVSGKIILQTEPNKGTSLFVTIPI